MVEFEKKKERERGNNSLLPLFLYMRSILFAHAQVPIGEEEFIYSCHSALQWKRLATLGDKDLSRGVFLHVEGPHRLWLKKVPQFYFSLRLFGGDKLVTEVDTEGRI